MLDIGKRTVAEQQARAGARYQQRDVIPNGDWWPHVEVHQIGDEVWRIRQEGEPHGKPAALHRDG